LHAFIWMFEQHFLQISSNYEMVELEPFVELTRNDTVLIRDPTFIRTLASSPRRLYML